jgi:hypothetical protein
MSEAADDDQERPEQDSEPTAGDAQGVPVPHEQAAEGTSETFSAIEGVSAELPSTANDEDDLPAAGDFKDLST